MVNLKSGMTTSLTSFIRAQYKDSEQNISSGEVISVAKYLGNLQFQVWKKMQSFIKYCKSPVPPRKLIKSNFDV